MTENADQEIIASAWSTDQLAGFALTWYETSCGIVAGTERAQPVWRSISYTEEGAHEYYASLSEEERRSEAALALASGGWDIHKINRKKS